MCSAQCQAPWRNGSIPLSPVHGQSIPGCAKENLGRGLGGWRRRAQGAGAGTPLILLNGKAMHRESCLLPLPLPPLTYGPWSIINRPYCFCDVLEIFWMAAGHPYL